MTSSWKARGIAVRDARHTHNGPEIATGTAPRKNKRAWCRGVNGTAHELTVMLSRKEFFPRLIRYCKNCGREFGSYSNWGKPPEWATEEQLKQLYNAKAAK